MKKPGLLFLSLVFIFAITGCKDEPVNIPDDIEDNPPVINGISYTAGAGAAQTVTRGGTVELVYDSEAIFTANTEDADVFLWTADPPGKVSISNASSLSPTIKGIAEGQTEITFTAKNGELSDTFKFKIVVGEEPETGFFFRLFNDSNLVENNSDFPITTLDSTGLTFIAEAREDGTDVSGTVSISWEADSDDIVILSDNEGSTVTIVPTGDKIGVVTVTVSAAPSNTTDYSEEIVEFTITVTRAYGANTLFEWHHSDIPLTAEISLNQNFAWLHPDASQFRNQGIRGRVSDVRLLGASGSSAAYTAKGFQLGSPAANNTRFAIGKNNTANSTADNTAETAFAVSGGLGGQIDLYRKVVKLTIGYADAVNPGNTSSQWILRIGINDSTANLASMYGSLGTIAVFNSITDLQNAAPGNTADKGSITIEIDTTKAGSQPGGSIVGHDYEIALGKAFIGLHAQQTANITVTSIMLEYVSGEPSPGDPVALSLQKDVGGIQSDLSSPEELNAGGTLNVIAAAPEAGLITWASSDAAVVSINSGASASGASVTLKAENAGGPVKISVKAEKAGCLTMIKLVNVTVAASGVTPAAKALIFEWTHAAQGEPAGMVWNSGAATANSINSIQLPGNPAGIYSSIPFSISTPTNGNTEISYDDGILIEASTSTGTAKILTLGTNIGRSETSTNALHPSGGIFNIRETGSFYPSTTGIKVTLTADILTDATGTRSLSIFVNNNTAAAANLQLAGPANPGRIFYFATPTKAGTVSGNNGVYASNGTTMTSVLFTPTAYTAGLDTLESAFFSIVALGFSTTYGAKVKITGIKIEYTN